MRERQTRSTHPGVTECHYADAQFIPVLDSTGLFLDQEGFFCSTSLRSVYTGSRVTRRKCMELDLVRHQTFPRLAAELGKQAARGMILDGEIVAFDAE